MQVHNQIKITKSSVIDIASKPKYFPDTSQNKGPAALQSASSQAVGPPALVLTT